MKVQGEAIRRSKEIPSPLTTHSRGRVCRFGLRQIALVLLGVVSTGMLGSAPITARAFGERVRHAAAGAPHPVRNERNKVQKAKADIRAYVNDAQCGKSGAINGIERFFVHQQENLKTAKQVAGGLKRASPPLADAVAKAAEGAAAAAALAKRYPSAVAPAVGAIKKYHEAMKTERRDEAKMIAVGSEVVWPFAEDVTGIVFCAKAIIKFAKAGGEAAAAPETGGASAAPAVVQIPEGAVEGTLGCVFTRHHLTEIPKNIATAKEFLELVRKVEEDDHKAKEQQHVVESAITAAGKKIPPAGQSQLANLRATMEAASRDADRSHAIVQSTVTPQLREALQRTTLHLKSGASTVATCARKMEATGKHVKRDLTAGL